MKLIVSEMTVMMALLSTGMSIPGGEPTPSQPPTPTATAATETGHGPRIQFADPIYNFGKAIGDTVIEHAFIFTNTGDRLLEITEVKTSCGCAHVGNSPRRIEPGKNGVIPIELHTLGLIGAQAKPVTVACNDLKQPTVTLQMTGTVWRPIELIPLSAAFGALTDETTNATTLVRIINHQTEPLTLSEPESNNRRIAAELKTAIPGKEYRLVVRLVPPLGSGNVFGNLTLKTSATNMPVLSVPVWAVAQQAVTVTPPQFILPPGPMPSATTQSVSIRANWSSPLLLSEPTLSVKNVEARLWELQPGRFFTVTMVFPEGFELPQGAKAELSVKSNHPQYPVVRVPITQRSRPIQSVVTNGAPSALAVQPTPAPAPERQRQ